MKTRLLIMFVIIGMSLVTQQAWAPDIDNFYGFSHFKDLPLLHPGETKSFEIKIENAAGSTLYDLVPGVSVYPIKSLPFVSIQTDTITELKNGQIGTIHGIIKADSRLPLEDLQLFVVFTAKDEDGKVLTGGWSDHLKNTISVRPLSPETKTYHGLSPLEQFKSGIPIDKIEFIDGKPFFVSEKYNAARDPNKIIQFHGVTFTHPAFPDPPAPGGGAFTKITFPDGTKETLSQVGLLKYPILLTKHVNPQAGMRENPYDTFSIFVSADLTKISPLQQFKAGIPLTEIKCKANLTLLKKTSNELPVCVSIKTGQKLLERKWAQPMAVTAPLESMQKSDSYQREITILSISPKNVTLPDHPETPWTEIQIKESIGKSKPLEITNPVDGNDIHLAKLTIVEVTIHTRYDDNSTGYNTLIFKYLIENVDKDAFYAMPDFEAHFGNRIYPSQMIGDEFSTMLLPGEKKDSSFAVQIGKGANQILLVIKDPATKQTLWSFPVAWHIPSLKNEGHGVLIQE